MIASRRETSNRIVSVAVRDHWVDPTEAELWITVFPERITSTTEARGRLMGPRCLYSTTVEVAYPLRPFARLPEGLPGLPRRVLIPEANLWDPVSPFIYQGLVELWEKGKQCDQVHVSHGLRSLGLATQGLRLNGSPFLVRGAARTQCSEEEAHRLHQAGHNTLLVPVSPTTVDLWDTADRVGFLMLGQVDGSDASLRQAETLRGHPSCLGWVLSSDSMDSARLGAIASALNEGRPGHLVGMELDGPWMEAVPPGIHFLLGNQTALPTALETPVPGILRLKEGTIVQGGDPALAGPAILGWVGVQE